MSRRARLEEEKLRQLHGEIEEEENRIKAQRERIYAPIMWKRLASGISIQDLKPSYYDKVLQIIEECYLEEDVLCRNSDIKADPASIKSLLNSVHYYLEDKTSIIALDAPHADAVAGFLVLKVMHKSDYSNVLGRSLPIAGDAHKKYTCFINHLDRKADVYAELECDRFLRFILLCITPEYRHKGLGLELFLTGVDVARSLNIPVVMGILSCWTLQKLGKKIGMKVIHEIKYVDWRDRFNEMIFDDPGVGNYTCAVMAGAVPPPPEVEPPPKSNDEEERVTREARRKAQTKGKKKKGT